jgi:hypothetical protein
MKKKLYHKNKNYVTITYVTAQSSKSIKSGKKATDASVVEEVHITKLNLQGQIHKQDNAHEIGSLPPITK